MRRHGLDLLIVIVALEAALEVALRPDAPELTPFVAVPATVVLVLALLRRRRAPFVAPAALWLLAAALSFVDGELVTFAVGVNIAGLIAAFLLGNLPDARQARFGLAIVVGGALIVMFNATDLSPGEVLLLPVVFALAWLAGFALRERATQAEAAEAEARVAVAEERTRIARELHDIVAHSVSVMVLQVGAVRHRLPAELAEDVEALRGVEKTGRTALADMRRLLEAMRDEAALGPQPGLERLGDLLQEVRRAGLPVDLEIDGEPFPLPGALDLSAYRIVQEGLTNALKHARASQAHVVLGYGARELRIDVRDDGRGDQGAAGHGLVGIRERVKIYGGEMTAGSVNGGGFVLSTRLPLT
jgi:signal transduction histidine kinase